MSNEAAEPFDNPAILHRNKANQTQHHQLAIKFKLKFVGPKNRVAPSEIKSGRAAPSDAFCQIIVVVRSERTTSTPWIGPPDVGSVDRFFFAPGSGERTASPGPLCLHAKYLHHLPTRPPAQHLRDVDREEDGVARREGSASN